MPRKVTIQDISRAAGTSPSTVSRVLTGNAGVRPEKREAVEAAIRRLNYRPSHIARGLKTNITFTVGLLLNDITNTFYSTIARGVEEEANRHGYSLVLCNTSEEPERELHYLEVLQDKHVDGIILGPTGQNEPFICDLARRKPLVQVDRRINANITSVVVDNEDSAYRATRLLIDRGHRRIGVVKWHTKIVTIEQRYAGYERALREAGLPIDPALVVEVPSLNSTQAAEYTQRLLQASPPPTALFALNNQIGLGALGAIQRIKLHIPDDVALIVFDDADYFAVIMPSITAIAQPAFQMGEQAMRLLAEQIEHAPNYEPEQIVLQTELITRESI